MPPEKLVDYLLNPDHPTGAAKARFFLGQGFERSRPDVLMAALMQHPADHPAVAAGLTPFGQKYKVEGAMLMPSGRSARIRTIWMLHRDTHIAAFVSAYPR